MLPTPVFLGFPCGSAGKESACNAGDLGLTPGLRRSPGEGNDYHSSILAWRIPWTAESMGSQRVWHNWVTFTFKLSLRKPKNLSSKSQGTMLIVNGLHEKIEGLYFVLGGVEEKSQKNCGRLEPVTQTLGKILWKYTVARFNHQL